MNANTYHIYQIDYNENIDPQYLFEHDRTMIGNDIKYDQDKCEYKMVIKSRHI
jgi:hypothetical protein